MITLCFLGLDQYVVGHYSKENTANLAQLYESDPALINFFAPNSMLFHDGVEQTSWNLIVIVRAPSKYRVLEKQVADYLLKTLPDFAINVEVEFEYFEQGSHYEKINGAYPRYMSEDNLKPDEYGYDGSDYHKGEDPAHDAEEEEQEGSDEDEADPRDRADLDPNDPNQIYLGDAFAGFEEKLQERERQMEEGVKKAQAEKKAMDEADEAKKKQDSEGK